MTKLVILMRYQELLCVISSDNALSPKKKQAPAENETSEEEEDLEISPVTVAIIF